MAVVGSAASGAEYIACGVINSWPAIALFFMDRGVIEQHEMFHGVIDAVAAVG